MLPPKQTKPHFIKYKNPQRKPSSRETSLYEAKEMMEYFISRPYIYNPVFVPGDVAHSI
jgi:hypothetical protein